MKIIHRIRLAFLYGPVCIAGALAAFGSSAALAGDAYVASTGAQAINTGYRVNSKTKLEVDFQIDTVVNQRYVFGASDSEGTTCCLWVNNNGNLEPNFGGWCGNIGGSATTTRRTIVYDLPNRIIELYEHGSASPLATKDSTKVSDNGESNCPIALFANTTDASGAAAGFGTCRIYSFKVWEGATLVHDWQPAVKGGEAGFVDAVDGSFIGQTTPGAGLTASGDYATLEGDDAPYIESDGTTVVNTGVKPSPELRVEIDYALSTTDQSDVRIAGTEGSGQTFEFYVNQSAGMACCIAKGWKSQYIGPVDTRRHTFIADVQKNKCSFVTGDSTNYSSSANAGGTSIDAEGAYPIGLFGRITGANGATDWAAGRSKARIYGVRFFKNGDLVKNLIPCVKGDAAGFRDTIGGTFHTGEFNIGGLLAGGNVERIPDDGYVELCGNDQTQADALKGGHYFDTGYTPGPNTRIELDYALAENHSAVAADWYLLNAGNGTEAAALYQNATAFGACLGTAMWKGAGLPSQANAALVRRTAVLDSANKAVTILTAGYTNYANTNDMFTAFSANAATSIKLGSTAGGGGGYTPIRVYGLKIYEAGDLVHDYKPEVRNGAPVLASGSSIVKVSWHYNLGAAGMPKAGGDITVSSARDKDAFVLFTGAQSLDTGYKASGKSKFVVDFSFANGYNKPQQFVFNTSETEGEIVGRAYTSGGGGNNANYAWNFFNAGKWPGTGVAVDHQRRLVTIDALNGEMRMTPGATEGSTVNQDSLFASNTHDGACQQTTKIGSNVGGTGNFARMRLYRLTIYDDGEKVREYVPAVVNGAAGLRDLVHPESAPLTAAGLTVSGFGHDGAEEWAVMPQNVNLTQRRGSTTLKAFAIGAKSYKWTKNGEPISDGANGSIDVVWAEGGETDIYSVTAVYDVFGEEVEGSPVQVSVTNVPPGLRLVIR